MWALQQRDAARKEDAAGDAASTAIEMDIR
jgi:hypothetical protein